MSNLEVEVMLENHPHLFLVEVESVLEAEQLKGTEMTCPKCKFRGRVARIGRPGHKANGGERPVSPGQKSILEE